MWIFTLYMALLAICGLWAEMHANDTDKNGYFKVPWRLYIFTLMFLLVPLVAKLCGLI